MGYETHIDFNTWKSVKRGQGGLIRLNDYFGVLQIETNPIQLSNGKEYRFIYPQFRRNEDMVINECGLGSNDFRVVGKEIRNWCFMVPDYIRGGKPEEMIPRLEFSDECNNWACSTYHRGDPMFEKYKKLLEDVGFVIDTHS